MKKFALDKYRDCKHEYARMPVHFGMDFIRTKEICRRCGLNKEMEEAVNNLIKVEDDRRDREEQKGTQIIGEKAKATYGDIYVTDVPLEEGE